MRLSTLTLGIVLFSASSLLTSPFIRNALSGEPTGALKSYAKSRTWLDATGKHKIQGSMKFADEKEVQIAQSNGKLVKIKLSGLSAADRKFVNEFLAEEASSDSGASESPFLVQEDGGDDESMTQSGGTQSRGIGGLSFEDANEAMDSDESKDSASVDTNEIPRRKSIVQNVKRFSGKFDKPFWSVKPIKGFPDVAFDESGVTTSIQRPTFSSMDMLTAGSFGVSVVGVYQQGKFSADYSKFLAYFAKDGSVSEVLECKEPWKLVAISPDGKRVACLRIEGFDKGNDVAIFNVTKSGLTPHFQFTAGGGSWDEIHFVDFAAGNRLVTISQKNTVGVWDLSNEQGVKALYVGNSGGSHHAVLSPARELMALPAGNGVAIIDIAAAKLAGLIERKNKPSQLSFSPDGKRLAVFEPFEVAIYNLESGELLNQVPVSEHNGNAVLNWLGKYFMIGNVVYDVERSLPVWTYESDGAVRSTLGSYVFSAFPSDKETHISLLKLPHDRAVEAAARIDPTTIFAVNSGDEISVEYNFRTTPSDKQTAIKKIIDEKIIKLGWKQVPAATIRLVIDMEQGKSQTADYYTSQSRSPFMAGPMFGRPTGPKETVSYTPWTQKLQIFTGDKLEFESVGYIGAPSNFSVNDGESTQSAVSRLTQPGPNYFEYLAIPPKLLKREYQGGMGKSKITADGLN